MSKLKLIIFIFFGLFAVVPELYAADGDCKPQELEKIKKNINQTAIAIMNSVKSNLGAYNSIAKQYEEKCNVRLKKNTPVTFTDRGRQSILILEKDSGGSIDGTYFIRQDTFDYTNVAWNAERPTKPECKTLQKRAADLQIKFNNLRAQAENILGVISRDKDANLACVCDKNGQNSECTSYSNEAHEAKDQIDGCKPFASYLSDLASCPLCPIFQTVLDADASLASIAWKALASALQPIVLTFFLVYLALQTLKTIFTPSGAGTGAYLKAVIGLGLKVAISYYLLSSSADIYNYAISPIVKGGLDMGMALLSIGNPGAKSCIDKASMFSMAPGGEMDASLMGSIYNAADCFSQSASTMPSVGRALMCYAWEKDAIPDFGMWADGLVIYIFGLGIWMVIGFYLIDCTVQLGILCAFVPVLIACWPFKLTTKYTNKGMSMLMNTFFNFALAGVMLVVGMEIIGYSAGGKKGDLSTLLNALNENDLKTVNEIASLDGMEVLILIACCIFAFKMIGIINGSAQQFASGSQSSIAAGIGGAAASVATAVAKPALKLGGKAISSTVGYAANKTGITGFANKAGKAISDAALSAASKSGKMVGLGRFQPGAQRGMPPQTGGGNNGSTPNSGNGNSGGNNSNSGGNNDNPGGDNNNSGGDNNNPGGNNGNPGGNNNNSGNNGNQPTP